jgi:hypothetical protein
VALSGSDLRIEEVKTAARRRIRFASDHSRIALNIIWPKPFNERKSEVRDELAQQKRPRGFHRRAPVVEHWILNRHRGLGVTKRGLKLIVPRNRAKIVVQNAMKMSYLQAIGTKSVSPKAVQEHLRKHQTL